MAIQVVTARSVNPQSVAKALGGSAYRQRPTIPGSGIFAAMMQARNGAPNGPASPVPGAPNCGCPGPMKRPTAALLCASPALVYPQNAGDISPGNQAMKRVNALIPSCGFVRNAPFQQSYAMMDSSLASTMLNARAVSDWSVFASSAVSAGAPFTLSLDLNSAGAALGINALGLELVVSIPETAAAGPFTAALTSQVALGSNLVAYTSGSVLLQTGSDRLGDFFFFGFTDINKGSYYYAPFAITETAGGAFNTSVLISGLPSGATATLLSVPTDSPGAALLVQESQ